MEGVVGVVVGEGFYTAAWVGYAGYTAYTVVLVAGCVAVWVDEAGLDGLLANRKGNGRIGIMPALSFP